MAIPLLLSAAAILSVSTATQLRGSQVPSLPKLPLGVIPPNSLTHFCIVTGWDLHNQTVATYSTFLGQPAPVPGLAGGPDSNGTYMGQKLLGYTKIAFMELNNMTRMEFLAGEPDQPSWWRDVYFTKGYEVHHMGYQVTGDIMTTAAAFTAAGLGPAVQWGRWGVPDQPGGGCYIYMDSQESLGVTVEILANGHDCDNMPYPPS